jgi:endonuclease YncB( thermonuclease family)
LISDFPTSDFWFQASLTDMELASRIVSVLLGLAVMVFVLWPVTVPVGFGEVWWASRQGQARPDRPPASPPASQPDAKPATSAAPAAAHAVDPNAPPSPAQPASGNEDAAKVATVPGNDKTGAVVPQAPAPPAMPQAAAKLYHRVTVRDGATLQSGKIVIRLAGIVAREAKATCEDEKGKTWSCGAAAKVALTRLIRGRAISCALPQSGEHNIFDARCSVGGTDLSAWMVQQGWAEADDPSLADAAKQAKADRLGLWR